MFRHDRRDGVRRLHADQVGCGPDRSIFTNLRIGVMDNGAVAKSAAAENPVIRKNGAWRLLMPSLLKQYERNDCIMLAYRAFCSMSEIVTFRKELRAKEVYDGY